VFCFITQVYPQTVYSVRQFRLLPPINPASTIAIEKTTHRRSRRPSQRIPGITKRRAAAGKLLYKPRAYGFLQSRRPLACPGIPTCRTKPNFLAQSIPPARLVGGASPSTPPIRDHPSSGHPITARALRLLVRVVRCASRPLRSGPSYASVAREWWLVLVKRRFFGGRGTLRPYPLIHQ
jgi:hypothetical protein